MFEGDDDDEDEEEEEEEENPGESNAAGAADGEEGAPQEDNDDFAVAWDVLDLARVLYHKVGTEEALLKLGDVHMALGDVSLESENFEQAVADFREALLVKESRLESDDRQLAEAHYKLALALEFSPTEASKASEHITKAIGVLKQRIERLNGLLGSGKGKARASDASESESQMAKELVELHEFVGEMEQKVKTIQEGQKKKTLLHLLDFFLLVLLTSIYSFLRSKIWQPTRPTSPWRTRHRPPCTARCSTPRRHRSPTISAA